MFSGFYVRKLSRFKPQIFAQYKGCHHSLVDSSTPTILPHWVRVPCTPSMLLSFILKFVYWKEPNKRKRCRVWSRSKKHLQLPKIHESKNNENYFAKSVLFNLSRWAESSRGWLFYSGSLLNRETAIPLSLSLPPSLSNSLSRSHFWDKAHNNASYYKQQLACLFKSLTLS